MKHRNPHPAQSAPKPHPFVLALTLLSAVTLAAWALLMPAHGGDEGVYGPVAPPDSAFIRVFNATNRQIEDARIADKTFSEIPAYAASEFAFLPAGSYTLHVGGVTQQVALGRNRFHTAALVGNQLRLIDVDRFSNKLKSLVILYNLTDAPELSLKTPDGATSVVEPVAPNTSGAREVNAVRVNLGLFDGGKKVADVKPVNLQRGRAFSLFAAGSRESPMTVWVVN